MRERRDVAVDGGAAAPVFLGLDDLAGPPVLPRLASSEDLGRAGITRFRDGVHRYLGHALAGKLPRPPVELKRSSVALDLIEVGEDCLRLASASKLVRFAAACGKCRPSRIAVSIEAAQVSASFRFGNVADWAARPFARTCAEGRLRLPTAQSTDI